MLHSMKMNEKKKLIRQACKTHAPNPESPSKEEKHNGGDEGSTTEYEFETEDVTTDTCSQDAGLTDDSDGEWNNWEAADESDAGNRFYGL